jgi:hypothetical protein
MNEHYSDEEATGRFDAALRGARTASPTPMKDIVGKGHKSRVKKTAQAKGRFKRRGNRACGVLRARKSAASRRRKRQSHIRGQSWLEAVDGVSGFR